MSSPNSSPPPESDLYDLSPETPRATKPPRLPISSPTLAYRAVAVNKSPAAPTDTDALKNFKIPLALLTVGVVIHLIAAWFQKGNLIFNVAVVPIGVILSTGVTLVAILLAARLRAIELGQFRHTVLKLAAIDVFPSAVFVLLLPALKFIPILGPLGGAIGEFILYFALLGVLFDLQESDTWFCVAIIFLVNLSIYFLLKYMLGV